MQGDEVVDELFQRLDAKAGPLGSVFRANSRGVAHALGG